MLDRLLPARIDNSYRGYKFALWLYSLMVFLKTIISCNAIFNGHMVASQADGIPLASFSADSAGVIVALFALLGLADLMLCLVGIVVMLRYRALVPFMFTLFLLDFVCKKVILALLPIVSSNEPAGLIVTAVLLAVMVAGFVLSLKERNRAPAAITQ